MLSGTLVSLGCNLRWDFEPWSFAVRSRLTSVRIAVRTDLVLLLFVKPHKRSDVGLMAFAVQTCVVLIFCMAQWIMFFNMLDDVASDLAHQILGFDSIDKLVASIIAINLTFLVLMVLSALYD
eukprot:2201648-Prymnesium_polylepis.1